MKDTTKVLMDFIDEQAALHPNHPAVISRAGETSYGELVCRMSGVSAGLSERGIVRETPVAVSSDRSLAWIVGALGVLHAGGMYIPVDPLYPLKRKIRMLEDAGVRLMLIDAPPPAPLPDSIELAMLDGDWPVANSLSEKPEVIPGQAAYGIYTSGSTGTPKNVIVTHEGLANYAVVLRRELLLTSADRYLHTASLAFSASMRQLVAPLVSGAGVVIATREQIRDPASLIYWMLQAGVTVFDTVPSYLARWLAAVLKSPRDWREKLAVSLRLVLTTGEPLPAATVNSLRAALPNVRILNLYGQTETTGAVAIHEVETTDSDPVPIGRALPPSQFYVLNEQMEPSVEGELYVSGPCLARCYQGQPDTNASRFLGDPFSAIPGARMYRTGDRVRRLNNGLFEFKGRTDSQVKVNGIRIELGEIDAALLEHPDVQEATTVLRSTGGQDLGLVAFVVRRAARGCSSEELRAFLATALAEAMVPGVLVFVDELPRTSSGKVDRPSLLVADISPSSAKPSVAAPSTRMECLVAKCWEDELKVTGIGLEDDFFTLGGNSLQAIEMIYRLQELLPAQLPLSALFFQDPMLKGFAALLSELFRIEERE
jgi:aspartate racemase